MLHVRPSAGTQNAHEDALDILESIHKREGDRLRGNTHFFTGSLPIAMRYWDLGFTTAFPGVITFTDEYDEVVKAAPKTMILSETDAPYASPEPHRGRRNEPVYVIETIRRMAELRNEPQEDLERQLVENALRVFNIAL
jgi:TatD DNase family protein